MGSQTIYPWSKVLWETRLGPSRVVREEATGWSWDKNAPFHSFDAFMAADNFKLFDTNELLTHKRVSKEMSSKTFILY